MRLSGFRDLVKLAAGLIAALGGACVSADSRDRHAAVVDVFAPTPTRAPDQVFDNPSRALGPPDGRTVAVPLGSFVVLRFFRPVPVAEGPDLRIYEIGDDGAEARIAVSDDGDRFFELVLPASGPSTDLDLEASGLNQASYVRIRGLDMAGVEPGFDLDSVESLH